MTLEPSRSTILPLLEATPNAPRIEGFSARQSPDLNWRIDRPLTERLRFAAAANLVFEQGPTQAVPALAAELQLPDGANPRTLAWAARLRSEARFESASSSQLAAAVMQHIRRGGFVYTLTPGLYAEEGGLDAIDEFWLDRKQGFCEHYAAAFVVVMRAMGIPARIVTGYQGADALPVDGYLIVRQSNAHAWAEYWERGRGWVRADPTAAVAPDRIVRSRRLRPPPGLVESTLDGMSPALLAQLRSGWEALNNRWNQSVLTYSRGQQFDLLRDIGFTAPSWEDLTLLLIGALSTLSLAGAAWAWWERRRQDPWARQAAQVRRALQNLGLAASTWHGPQALAAQTLERFGAAGEGLAALLKRLERQRYGRAARRHPEAGLTRALRREARQLARVAARQSTP